MRFFAPGLEECEGLVVVDLLRRAGVEVCIAAVGRNAEVTGSHKIAVRADCIAGRAADDWDAVFLPGGIPGTPNLKASHIVRSAVLTAAENGRIVAAICAAPSILGDWGLLRGRRATCYPGMEDESWGAEMVDADAVRDGNILTGRALGAAIPFALELVEMLMGKPAADKLKEGIVYRG